MHILCIFLHDINFLEDFLDVLIEEEIEEVFVSDAEVLKEILAFKFPLFKELQTTIGMRRKEPKIIFALIDDEKKIEKMVNVWKEELQLDKEEIAMIVSFPVKLWQSSPHIY
ncbi:hypothetical protein IBX65_04630 [Candidatus Aerophobetes bacterium]|nr:hypothetical protein [Candidatus Aerophobetes bacterium]